LSIKFLGASVSNLGVQLGWNENSSNMSITVAEDDGDQFLPAIDSDYIGKACYFEYGALKYGGILSSWSLDESTGGKLFNARLDDPKQILDGCQVVLNHFQIEGNLDQVILRQEMPNFLNVYDYWETAPYGGFGGASVNEAGMPYFLVKSGIRGILENYGPLKFRGVDYYIDFEGLPTPPEFYRIGGDSLTLLELVSILCQDSGADFFCNLENRNGLNYITFKSVYRTKQPPLGQIKVYVDYKRNLPDIAKTVSSNSRGIELRNDVVSMILVGGNREDIHFVDNSQDYVRPFWGYSTEGYAYTSLDYENLTPVTINCSEISNLVDGATTYTTKIIELKAALYNFDTWAIAVERFNPAAAEYLKIKSCNTLH
jgi:hypothetical protein